MTGDNDAARVVVASLSESVMLEVKWNQEKGSAGRRAGGKLEAERGNSSSQGGGVEGRGQEGGW